MPGKNGKHSRKLLELQSLIAQGRQLPKHVAIIMDGNGRWAQKRGLPRVAGHHEGVKSVRAVVEAAGELGIPILTLYAFSKENWQRPVTEVNTLMNLLARTMKKEINELDRQNVQIRVIGDVNDLPDFAYDAIVEGVKRTRQNSGLILNLALSYGGRAEILQAVRNIAQKVKDGELFLNEINEEIFREHLYTSDLPDPDLLIRTSGEQRISNFLLWQIAYTEIYVTRTLWPDFRKSEFYHALIDYMHRDRRFGKVKETVSVLMAEAN